MFYVLEKTVQQFFRPIVWVLLLLAWYAWRQRGPSSRKSAWALYTATVVLFLSALPITGDSLFRFLEGHYTARALREVPPADAIVVLGGSTGQTSFPRLQAEEMYGSRLLPAARLLRLKKANWIVVSGGSPYRDSLGQTRTDADDMKEILIDIGVPAAAILSQSLSRTTQEDAKYTARLLKDRGIKKVILVTSAFHMPRAAMMFRKFNVEITSVPAGHEVVGHSFSFLDLFPTEESLYRTSRGVKEVLGYMYFSLFPGV